MLRISKLADYGTVVMVYLAQHAEELANARDIAQKTHLSVPTVSKLLKILTASKLLTSQRGAKGGYCLATKPKQISIAQIIQAVEGTAGLTQCSDVHDNCVLEPVCSIRGNWRLINQAIQTALDSVSLADLAKPHAAVSYINVSAIRHLSE